VRKAGSRLKSALIEFANIVHAAAAVEFLFFQDRLEGGSTLAGILTSSWHSKAPQKTTAAIPTRSRPGDEDGR